MAAASTGLGQEIAPLRITGVSGYAQVVGLQDTHSSSGSRGQPGARSRSEETQSSLREEVFIDTKGYVYHPNLLAFDIGGGVLYDDAAYEVNGSTTSSGKPLFSFVSRAMLLRGRPYSGSLFYERLNPTLSVGPAEILLSENQTYGLDFALLQPVTPVAIYLDASRSRNTGDSSQQTIDDRTDQIGMRFERRIGRWGDTRLRLQSIDQESRNGAKALPIQASAFRSQIVDSDTRFVFGGKAQYEINNLFTYSDQEFTAGPGPLYDTQDLRLNVDFRGRHSERLQTNLRYSFTSNQLDDGVDMSGTPGDPGSPTGRGVQKSWTNAASASVSYWATQRLFGSADLMGDRSRGSEVSASMAGVSGRVEYRWKMPVGETTINYTISYADRDQTARTSQAQIVGEHLTLSGTTPVPLSRTQVLPGSVSVSNAERSQVYVEGVDYALTIVGLTTRIERRVGGSIVDGQTVLADYEYSTGGTYALQQLDNAVSVSWNYKNYGDVYFRFLDSSPRVKSGAPTFQLNPVRSLIVGARGDFPLPLRSGDWVVGGTTEWENRDEVIAPGSRGDVEVYLQTPVPWISVGSLHFGVRRTQIRYDLQPKQDLDRRSYDVRLWTRFRPGINLSADATREDEVGPQISRHRSYGSLLAQWRIRHFEAIVEYRRTFESQGVTDDQRTVARFSIRRTF